MRKVFFQALLILVTFNTAVLADQDPPTRDNKILLAVAGILDGSETRQTITFDRAMLEGLPQRSFETTTIWTEGIQTFSGVSLRAVYDFLKISGKDLQASASNEYSVLIPASDIVEGGPIIAMMRNGKDMSLRNKGPLWIVYPYDNSIQYQTEVIYSRSIWQVTDLEVLD